ncbi:phage tail protein [Leucobacter sp. VD1]|uniref:phage tail protein n=1 Tax=Leucobacter sp. VD1 TaxID=3080381 RepID=UPI0030165FA9
MSSEVGSAHISIFPVMTGFKSRVSKDTKQAGAAGAKSFDAGFKGAGQKAGRSLGADLKSSLSTSAGNLGAAELSKLNRNVSAAAAALSRARLKQQDEAGKVRVAEVRLQEAIAKSGEGSSQAVAAEERLATARRNHAAAVDTVSAASKRLKTAQDAVNAANRAVTASTVKSAGGLKALAQHIHAGYSDARAAQSAFTGVAGSIGGIAKETLVLARNTTLGRWAATAAQQTSRAFTSMATMVGGGLAKAWQASSRWISGVGSYVRSAFAPMGQYAAAAGTLMAAPFMRLGARVSSWLTPVTTQVSGLFSKIAAAGGPAAQGLIARFRSGLAGIGSATSSALQSVVTAASSVASRAGAALGNGLRNTAAAGVTAAAAGIGVALGKGFGRLTAIDTAQAKLRGLGNDAGTVTAIMGDAMASVKGTSFGLGEAATVAASAVAAGIRPGEALQGHLKRIANNASAAGMSMEEMGGIFNRAATQANGVQNDVISQLADRGIPIYQALADQLGVTSGEVFKMASEGKIDFETFSAAAEKAAGTVAEEMGKTVPGASKNFFAAMGRIGANALEGIYGKIGPLIAAATSALGPIEERAKAFGTTLTTVLGPAMDWVTNALNQVGSGAGGVLSVFDGLGSVIAPLGAAFAALGAGGIAGVLARLGPLGALLPGLGGALAALGSPLGIVAAALAGFALSGGDAGAVVSALTGILDQVVAALPGIVQQVATVVPQLVSSIVAQVPLLLTAASGIITALIEGLVAAIPMLVSGAVQLVQGLVQAITANLPLIIDGAIQLVIALIQGIITALPLLIEGAIQLVSGLLTAIVGALPMIIEGGIQLLMALVMGLVAALPQLLQAALDLVMGLLGAIIDNLPMIIEAGIQLLMSLIEGLIGALPQLITAAIDLVLRLVTGLLQMLPELIRAGIELVVALIKGLVEAIPQILQMLPQIISAIWDGLMGVNWLDLGVQIVMGIINGLGSMVGSLVDAIVDLAGAAFDGFKDFFGIKSPARRMIQPGRDVVRGAVVGVDSEADSLGDSLVSMAESASRRAQAAMSSVSATITATSTVTGQPGTGGQAPSSSTVVEINGNVYGDPEHVAEEIDKKRRRADAVYGVGGIR